MLFAAECASGAEKELLFNMDKLPTKTDCEFSVNILGALLRLWKIADIMKDSVHKGIGENLPVSKGTGNKSRKEYNYELFP